MTTNLEHIAKQVSLLNRLLELLRMQEDFGWVSGVDHEKWGITHLDTEFELKYVDPGEAWNHPVTQKAWGDELVKVTRELWLSKYPGVEEALSTPMNPCIADLTIPLEVSVQRVLEYLVKDKKWYLLYFLKLILGKYNRGLSE